MVNRNKVIQAVAGSGKTYYGTHELIKDKRCLYLTFTNGNVKNCSYPSIWYINF